MVFIVHPQKYYSSKYVIVNSAPTTLYVPPETPPETTDLQSPDPIMKNIQQPTTTEQLGAGFKTVGGNISNPKLRKFISLKL